VKENVPPGGNIAPNILPRGRENVGRGVAVILSVEREGALLLVFPKIRGKNNW
jgi:hypothetical protein